VYDGHRNILFGRGNVPRLQFLLSTIVIFIAANAFTQEIPEDNESPAVEEVAPVDPLNVDESTLTIGDPEAPLAGDGGDLPLGEGVEFQTPGIPFTDILTMILVLAFVIALIYGSIWLLRKLSKGIQNTSKTFTLMASFALSPNKLLQIIDVAGEVFLISVTDHNINLISKLDNKETLDQIRLNFDKEEKGKVAANFGEMLAGFLGNKKEKDDNNENSSNFIKKQKERLKNL
jgi:flagellar biosynthetic protein FliO